MESLDQINTSQSQSGYRLVSTQFFCYICKEKKSKLVNVGDMLRCDDCGEGFVEIMENSQKPKVEDDFKPI
jgi:hypothetical protein